MIRLFYFLCFLQFITLGLARTRVPGAMPILRAKLEKLVAVGQSTARYGKEEYRFNDLIQPLIIHGSFEDFYEMVESRRIATKTAGLLCMGSIIKPGALSVLDQSMKSAILVPEERSGEVIYTPLGAYAMDAMVALVNQGVTDSNFVLKPSELIKRLIEVLSDDRLTYLHFRARSILQEFIGERRFILNLRSLLIQLKEFSAPVLVKALGRTLSKQNSQNPGQALVQNFLWKCYEDESQKRTTRLAAVSALLRDLPKKGLYRIMQKGQFIRSLSSLEQKALYHFDLGKIDLQELNLKKIMAMQQRSAWQNSPKVTVNWAFKALIETRRGIKEHFLSWDSFSNLRYQVFDALYLAYPGTYRANPYQFQFHHPFGWPEVLSQKDVREKKLDQRFELKLRPLLIIEN